MTRFCAYSTSINEQQTYCHNKFVAVENNIVYKAVCEHCPLYSRVLDQSQLRVESMIASNPNFKDQPSIFEIGKEFVKGTLKHVVGGAQHVSDEVYQERLNICNNCEFRQDNRCTICTCNLSMKAKRSSESCPKGYWKAVS